MTEVANRPIVISLDATFWKSYFSGVLSACMFPPAINHAVLLTGYDSNYNWLIKNSWGIYWGTYGYITLKKGSTCGITTYPAYSPYFWSKIVCIIIFDIIAKVFLRKLLNYYLFPIFNVKLNIKTVVVRIEVEHSFESFPPFLLYSTLRSFLSFLSPLIWCY